MPRKLLLLADDQSWSELRRVGGLPDRMWADRQRRHAEAGRDDEAVIIRHDPELIASRTEHTAALSATAKDGQLDEEGRDELFAELLGSVVCNLVVIEKAATEPRTGADDEPGPATSTLSPLVRWYEQFHAEATRRVARRQDDYRHVLILICADLPPVEEIKLLKRLTRGAGKEKLCDECYVMWQQLELGPQDVCHARYVWPIAVTRLLLKLLEDSVPQPPDRTQTFAWRAFELAPAVDPVEVEQKYHELLDDTYKGLRRAVEGGKVDWNSACFNPLPQSVDVVSLRGDKPINPGEFWHTFPAERSVDDVASPSRWEADLTEAGQKFAERLKRRAVLDDPPAWSEVQNVWSRVHGHPGYLSAALLDKNLAEGSRIDDRFAEIAANWSDVARCDQDRDAKIAEARRCAEVLAAAQSSYLEMLFRLVAAGVATLFVALLSMAVFYELLGSFWSAAAIALGAGLGALGAAFGFQFWERYRGEQSRDAFIDMLKDVDSLTRVRHEKCQTALERATTFWERLRTRSAASRLRQLLARAQAILDHELQPEIPQVEDPEQDAAVENRSASDAERDQRRRRQRARFVAKTSLRQAVALDGLEAAKVRELVGVGQLIRDCQEQFVQEVWRGTCLETDRARLGKISARVLIPRIRDFQDRFRAALVAEVNRQLIDQMLGQGVDLWSSELARLHNEPRYYYLSCPVAETGPREMHSILFLRSDFQAGSLTQQSGDVTVVASKQLSGLPVVGLLFQETPVGFAVENGSIKVNHVA